MTQVTLTLPDDLAERAGAEGLLSNDAIQDLLEDAMRRRAGQRLLEIAKQIHAASIPPMTDEEILAEVAAARADIRSKSAGGHRAGDS